MPARAKAVKTAAGIPVAEEPFAGAVNTATPSVVARYAKACVGFLVAAVGALGAWSATLPATGGITRGEWIGLAVALATPLAAAFGVALTTNAPNRDALEGDAGHADPGGLVWALVVVILVLVVLWLAGVLR